MDIPRSTYRLQVRSDFDLDAAAGVTDYLKSLGVDWVYLSPILTATAGSITATTLSTTRPSIRSRRGGWARSA